jgi:hypothetical protein
MHSGAQRALPQGKGNPMKFSSWLDTFLNEKGINGDEILEVEAFEGTINWIPVSLLTDSMKGACSAEQKQIKTLLVKVDFRNGDVRHCLTHLAKAIALPLGVNRL